MDTFVFLTEMVLLGCCVGIISNALGLGGGIVMVPAFVTFVPGMDAHTAKGTSLFIIVFVSAYNAWKLHQNHADKRLKLSAVIACGSMTGAFFAGWGTQFLSDEAVSAVFACVAMLIGLRTFFIEQPIVREADVRDRYGAGVGIGVATGLVSGATGVGGGAIMVPLALMAGLVSNARVVAMSNTVMVLTSLAAAMAHFLADRSTELDWTYGQVNVALAPAVLVGALLAARPGRWINARLSLPRRRLALGLLLVVLAGRMLWRAL